MDLALSPNGQFLFSADKSVAKVWKLAKMHGLQRVYASHQKPAGIALSNDGALLAAAYWEFPENLSRVLVLNASTTAVVGECLLPTNITALAFDDSHLKLAAGTDAGDLLIVNMANLKAYAMQRQAPGRITFMSFSADNSHLLAALDETKTNDKGLTTISTTIVKYGLATKLNRCRKCNITEFVLGSSLVFAGQEAP